MSVLDGVFVAAIITAAITAPFLFTRWASGKLIFALAVAIGLAVAASSTSISRIEVQHALQAEPSTVSVDGHQVQNPKQIVNALRSLQDLPAHHSSPAHRIRIDISYGSHLFLVLARDSSNPREYWVFYPHHFITRSNEIGRIVTPLFDAY